MSLSSPDFRSDGAEEPRVLPVTCAHCRTDLHLTIRSVMNIPNCPTDVVMVAYTCSRCRRFSEHPARVADLSAVLGRREQKGDVLIFGGHYMHCGQPMGKAGSEVRKLSAPLSTEGPAEDTLDVYLSTRVLRCTCGFQMELPG